MELCVKCKKRVAVVFISRLENNKAVNEGLCLKCARGMGIPQVTEMMDKMGITEEDLDRMDMEMEGLVDDMDSDGSGSAPALDIKKMFNNIMPSFPQKKEDGASASKGKGKKNEKEKKFLSMYCLDLTKRAANNQLDNVIGRERELDRVIQILTRRQKNNPCLIGEPGVGKTAMAEALAQRIVEKRVPYKLQNKEIHLVDLTAIVAGTQFRGQFESRIKGLIEEVKNLGNIILVIDEVHNLVGAGEAEGSMSAANILKPALSRGDIQVIGATTLKEYRKYIEKDSALERRFQPVVVEEPSINDSIKILEGIKGYYERFHGIRIPDATVRRTVILSERYITDRFLPDKAIDLLDEASAYLALNSPVIGEIDQLADTIKRDRDELEVLETTAPEGDAASDEAKLTERYERIAELKATILQKEDRFAKLSLERDKIELTTEHLAKVIEIWTGVPASNISEHEFTRIDMLEERLKKRIVGQDEAIDSISRAIKRNRAGVSYKKKPVSFIFAGPTGVGKTELVKTLASDLFDSPETLIRLDMSEFMEKHSVSRIIGAPPGYVGYDEAGQLTEKIRRKPYSVVLFDEIEKAHPDVMNVLLQILDDGRVTNAQGRVVNFENTVIVMTTNAGSNINSNTAGFGNSAVSNLSSDKTMKALGEFLRPEFLNRIDEIITFRQLSEADFSSIARIMLNELSEALDEKAIKFSYTDKAAEFIAKNSYSIKFGARNMRRYIQKNVEDEVANLIINGYSKGIAGVSLDCDGEKLIIESI